MVYRKNPFVRYQNVQGKIYLVNKHDIFELDDVGKSIWKIIDGNHTFDEMVASISEQYQTAQETIRADLTEFFQSLVDNSLVVLE